MSPSMRAALRLSASTVLGVALFALQTAANAQTYPTRPIKLVVPIGQGTNSDIASRLIAEHLSKKIGQPVVVENKPGAAGNIGAEAVAKAAPDGYTILFASNATHAANSALFKSLPYDPQKDFVPLVFLAWTPMVVAVRTGDPSSSLSALLAESKKRPRAISVAIPSTSSRVVLAEINRLGGTQLVPVGYNGSANAVTDLLGGHVDATIDTLGALKTYIQAGKITPLAVSLSERSAAMPNLPTIVEAGLNGFSVSPWNVIAAPAGTPAPIVELLSRRLREVFAEPEVRESLQNRNGLVFGKEEAMSVDEIRRFIADELAKWGQLIRTSGIQPQ